MLGELIGEEQGEVTGRRVLSTDGGHPIIEASFQASGTLLGAGVQDMGTYESVMRADGTLFGEGQGVVMTESGDTLTWHGSGVGHLGEGGAVSWRGAIFYDSPNGKHDRLTGIAAVFEFETDAAGKASAKLYEWK
ncbi:hypothetical protein [Streptomyces sp. NPDC086023]|uniref:hypothetical protein n=1 Tax=Streptomyces sp. NPDC086023 TaxID=3365746 RepID=UPI0037D452BA